MKSNTETSKRKVLECELAPTTLRYIKAQVQASRVSSETGAAVSTAHPAALLTHCVGGYDDGPPSTAWRGPGALGSDKEYSEARRQPTEREAEAQNTY